MATDKIVCKICGEELQEEESCYKCGPKAPKIYEKGIEIVAKTNLATGIRKINKNGITEIIEEHGDGKIERYDAKIDNGEIYQEITEERKTGK